MIEQLKNAIRLTAQGQSEDAKAIYEELLAKYPDDVNVLSVYGLFYVNIKNYDKACEILTHACEVKETFGTVSALGFAEFERRNYRKSAEILQKAILLGENPDIFDKLIISFFEIGDYKNAVNFAEKMFEKYPDDIRSKANKIKAMTHSGKMLEAEKFCIESLQQNMESPSLWFHLGYLKELIYNDSAQAKKCYQAALDLGTMSAHYNIAVSAQKLGQFEEAETHFKKMLEYFPNDKSAISSYGMFKLKLKRFKEGYEGFFKRDKTIYADLSKNFWQPGDSLNEEINVICDQGFGDHIMFSRYFRCIKNRKVNVGTRKSLIKLFKDNFKDINFISYEELNPEIQTVFVTDLPYVLNMDFSKIPFSEGYLDAKPNEISNEKLKVGFCWEAGSAAIRTMIQRTINIKFFEKMINLNNIQFYSFQVNDSLNGNEKFPQMINLAKDFDDFSDTASALKSMDVVVTVDTALAHLSGALGVKTFLLLPFASDWRWFSNDNKTEWYDSVQIFKQTDSISWEAPINSIIKTLSDLVK